MLKLLNNPKSDNTRNILNADLFVSNLKNTLKAFGFNPRVEYKVYRSITVYHITWNDDKDYDDIVKLKKEIALSLGIRENELILDKISENEVSIKVTNMKIEPLCLKEVLSDYKKGNDFSIVLGMDEYDKLVTFDFDKEKSLLVTGVSGIGKTNLFNNIIMNILINYSDVKIIILDSQSINYNLYSNVCEVINKEEDIIVKINLLRREFEDRVKNNVRDKIVIFIDEIYEILKLDSSVKDDINYLLEVGSAMGIYLVVSTDSVLEDDIYDLFNKDNVSKISFYLTSRGEYNMFLGRAIRENLGRDVMYLDNDKNLIRMSIPIICDDEIERVVKCIKEDK